MNPIRSLSAIPTRALLASFLLCFTLGWATAQEPADLLADYESASTALNESLEAFAADQVESLDALRRARDAFAPLAAELTPPLRRGLTTTFASAEGAIGNRSETDLRVQAAVLRGGFQRALYESALETASADLPRAQELLGVLATDLGMTRTVFSNASPRALQTAFEEQLAVLSLAQLGTGDDRESRYEALATVYGHVFLVQDSPRLPTETQATLLSAIQALVTDEPLAPTLETLRAQLTEFGQAAQTAGAPEGVTPASAEANPGAAAAEDTVTSDGIADGDAARGGVAGGSVAGAADGTLAGEAATGVSGNGVEESAEASTAELAEIDIAPALTPDVQAADIDAAAAAAETDNPAGKGDGAVGTPVTANPPAAPVNTAPNAAPNTPGTPLSPNDQLPSDLRNPLLLAAGALALIGFLGLLFSRRSPVPWRDTALALLLLPVIGEGIIALAPTVSPYLTPYTERYVAPLYRTYVAPTLEPYLTLPSGDLAAYSLFTNPYTQVVWLGLVILSSLCLLLGLRSPRGTTASRAVRSRPTQIADTAADTTVVVTPATPTTSVATSAHSDGGGRTPQTGQLSTGSGFNWDEDF